jgi:hypothetical protein
MGTDWMEMPQACFVAQWSSRNSGLVAKYTRSLPQASGPRLNPDFGGTSSSTCQGSTWARRIRVSLKPAAKKSPERS